MLEVLSSPNNVFNNSNLFNMERKNMIGMKFNRWTIIGTADDIMRKKANGKPQPVIVYICECECGTIKDVRQSNIMSGASTSCGCNRKEISRLLMKKLHKTQLGEGNPNWRGGIMKEFARKRNKERNTPESRVWTKQIKERDGECKNCGNTTYLQAHHIDSWIDNPDKRFDLGNGICLCKSCHHSFHKEYGFGNNNMEQLDEFLNTPYAYKEMT